MSSEDSVPQRVNSLKRRSSRAKNSSPALDRHLKSSTDQSTDKVAREKSGRSRASGDKSPRKERRAKEKDQSSSSSNGVDGKANSATDYGNGNGNGSGGSGNEKKSPRAKEKAKAAKPQAKDATKAKAEKAKGEKAKGEKTKGEKAKGEKAKAKAKGAKERQVVVEEDGSRWELGDDGYYYCIEEEIVEVGGESVEEESEQVQAVDAEEEQRMMALNIQRALFAAEEQVRENYGNIFQGIEDAREKEKKNKEKDKGKKNWKKQKEATGDGAADDDDSRGRSESPRSKRNPRKSRSPGSSSSSTVSSESSSTPTTKKRSSRSRSRGRAILSSFSSKIGDGANEAKNKRASFLGNSSVSHRSSNSIATSNLKLSRSSAKLPAPANSLARPEKVPPKESPDYDTTTLFGVDLDVVMARQARDKVPGEVPVVVSTTVEHIRQHGMQSPGLFRLCGHHATQMGLEAKLDEGLNELDIENIDINTVAALLKSFLHRLPFPLVPRSPFYPLFFSASALTSEETRIRTYIALLHALPPNSLALIRFLCLFLSDVAENSEKTLMTPSNLSLIFAPSFFGTLEDDLSVDMLGSIEPLAFSRASKFTASITEQLITNARMIFLDQPFTARVYKSLECFKALGGSIMTILRGDTLLVIHEDESGYATVMVGETWGKVPIKVLAEMQEVEISDIQCRDTAALFTNAGSSQVTRRGGAETIDIRKSNEPAPPSPKDRRRKRANSGAGTGGVASSSNPSLADVAPAVPPVATEVGTPEKSSKKGHRRQSRSLGRLTSDMLKDVLEGKNTNRRTATPDEE